MNAFTSKKSLEILDFIIDNLEQHSNDIVTYTSKKFLLTRQTIHKYIKYLIENNFIISEGDKRNIKYSIHKTTLLDKIYKLNELNIDESYIWEQDISKKFQDLPKNVYNIWQHAFTEMFNNIIDHSEANFANVTIKSWYNNMELVLIDDGVGIFRKIKNSLELNHEHEAVLELKKGKFTTDPKNHSGEGIFFTSRMVDYFMIGSHNVLFSHSHLSSDDYAREHTHDSEDDYSTVFFMQLKNTSTRTTKEIFDQFASNEDFAFNKTIIPLELAIHGKDNLISRSQAKRVLSRIENFEIVVFDFEKIDEIGQAFADEIFRVFANNHPNIELEVVNASTEVLNMIKRAKTKK